MIFKSAWRMTFVLQSCG